MPGIGPPNRYNRYIFRRTYDVLASLTIQSIEDNPFLVWLWIDSPNNLERALTLNTPSFEAVMICDDPVMEPELELDPRRPAQRILIVDDDTAQIDVLARALRSQGYVPLTADSGKNALLIARNEKPHLILLDIGLPDLDGLSVSRMLSDEFDTCNIPIIVVSGNNSDDIVRKCRSVGCRYFLRKPYDPNALLVLVQASLADVS